jgi:hypothetical protein
MKEYFINQSLQGENCVSTSFVNGLMYLKLLNKSGSVGELDKLGEFENGVSFEDFYYRIKREYADKVIVKYVLNSKRELVEESLKELKEDNAFIIYERVKDHANLIYSLIKGRMQCFEQKSEKYGLDYYEIELDDFMKMLEEDNHLYKFLLVKKLD